MATKANWPEKMVCKPYDPSIGNWWAIMKDGDSRIIVEVEQDDPKQAEARARQICALPKMVELLKKMQYKKAPVYPIMDLCAEAQTILREIGETE